MYLRLGDKAHAVEELQRGFELAARLLQTETAAFATINRPANPVATWSAAETYRRIVTVGVNASLTETRTKISEIPNASLRELEEVMLARALLGVPVRRILVAGDTGGTMTTEFANSFDSP